MSTNFKIAFLIESLRISRGEFEMLATTLRRHGKDHCALTAENSAARIGRDIKAAMLVTTDYGTTLQFSDDELAVLLNAVNHASQLFNHEHGYPDNTTTDLLNRLKAIKI
jgi:hypothetical protein